MLECISFTKMCMRRKELYIFLSKSNDSNYRLNNFIHNFVCLLRYMQIIKGSRTRVFKIYNIIIINDRLESH